MASQALAAEVPLAAGHMCQVFLGIGEPQEIDTDLELALCNLRVQFQKRVLQRVIRMGEPAGAKVATCHQLYVSNAFENIA